VTGEPGLVGTQGRVTNRRRGHGSPGTCGLIGWGGASLRQMPGR